MNSLLFLLVFSILYINPTLSQIVRIFSLCSPTSDVPPANYTTGGAYATNLQGLLKTVVTAAGSHGGYSNDTAGEGTDQAYALAVCYKDAPPDMCHDCLSMAAGNVTLACPRSVAAAILYNVCLLRYANASFFARSDMATRFRFVNMNNTDVDHYRAVLGDLMDRLTPAAAATLRFAAYGRANLTADQSLYGFTQCVASLSPADCRSCLQRLAASLPFWTIGGRAYSLTCYTRFELVPFYVALYTQTMVIAPDASSAPHPVASRGAKHRKFSIRLVLIVSMVPSALLLLACLIIPKLRKKVNVRSVVGMNSKSKDNIEELLENYGSLAPKRYKHSQLKEITESFSENLGHGGYGTVYKGRLEDGRFVAVKFLHGSTGNGEEFVNEVISIGRTSHVNVVTLLGFCLEGSNRALVYEYMPNGSLEKFIYDEGSKTTLGWEKLCEIAVGIARGLEYLHQGCNTRIIHFDIKPHNILLDHDFVPKIADFGLAKLCHSKQTHLSMSGMRGTVGFIGPEVFSRRFGVVSTKSDVYSYGMVILEMVGGRNNIRESVEKSSEVYFPNWIYSHLVQEGNLHSLNVSGGAEEIARKMTTVGLCCIQVSPMRRPTMSNVLQMFENSVDDTTIPSKQYFYSAIQEGSSEQ